MSYRATIDSVNYGFRINNIYINTVDNKLTIAVSKINLSTLITKTLSIIINGEDFAALASSTGTGTIYSVIKDNVWSYLLDNRQEELAEFVTTPTDGTAVPLVMDPITFTVNT